MPKYLMFGITKADAVSGSLYESSTSFSAHEVEEVNLKLNGNSCQGYPVKMINEWPVVPYRSG